MNAGKILVIGDSKSSSAASILAGSGESQICDWHSEQKAVEGAGDRKLEEFDPRSPEKWEVSFFRQSLYLIIFFEVLQEISEFCK